MRRLALKPTQLLVISFLVAISIGTFLLTLPQATKGARLSIIDALFTATSATCVTGLIVVETGHFSLFGQLVILSLIQMGGLGIMTFSCIFALILGRRITIRNRIILQQSFSHLTLGDAVVLLKYILIFTLSVEIIGALLLYLHGLSPHRWENLFYAIFHSISAFCNAGFSLFKDSLVGYKNDFLINFTITALIIIGGIGFIVITEIRNLLTRGGFKKVSLHTKVVLLISFLLILIATFAFFLLENHNTLTGLQTWEKLQASYFQAVTPRTAGFNTIPIEEMTNASLFFTIILMFIGGSSGSTAGGIKTATLAVLIGMILMNFRGGERIELFKKTIPNDIGQKALSIVLLSLSLIIFSTMVLVITESGSSFMEILFEVVSAFGTVGLSCGLTTKLSILGKLLIIATMFIGRIGPLTLALAIGERKSPGAYKYSEEKVFVG